MDEKTLKRLLRAEEMGSERFSGPLGASTEIPLRPHFGRCPDEAQLAAYVEHGLPDGQRAKVEAHLADCDACLGQVAFLARQPGESPAPVAPGAVARARDLVAEPRSFWRPLVLPWGSAAAAVATVVLVAVVVFKPTTTHAPAPDPVQNAGSVTPAQPTAAQPAGSGVTALPVASGEPEARSLKPEARPAAPDSRPPSPTVRNSASAVPVPSVISPAENATLARKDLEFRWQAVPGTRYYEVSLVTNEGSLVWHTRADGTRVRLPDETKLDTGAKYFLWVKAYLAGGETVKSATVSFHVVGQ